MQPTMRSLIFAAQKGKITTALCSALWRQRKITTALRIECRVISELWRQCRVISELWRQCRVTCVCIVGTVRGHIFTVETVPGHICDLRQFKVTYCGDSPVSNLRSETCRVTSTLWRYNAEHRVYDVLFSALSAMSMMTRQ
jgi:hypothetical protein